MDHTLVYRLQSPQTLKGHPKSTLAPNHMVNSADALAPAASLNFLFSREFHSLSFSRPVYLSLTVLLLWRKFRHGVRRGIAIWRSRVQSAPYVEGCGRRGVSFGIRSSAASRRCASSSRVHCDCRGGWSLCVCVFRCGCCDMLCCATLFA